MAFAGRPQEGGDASSTHTAAIRAAQGTSRHQRIRESRRLLPCVRHNQLPSTLSVSNSRWTTEPVESTEECMGRKHKKIRRVLHAPATAPKLFPMPVSTLGGWRPDAHRAMGAIAGNMALRTLSSLHYARAMLFQRHAALLAANNAI